jgi:hypothetical protein
MVVLAASLAGLRAKTVSIGATACNLAASFRRVTYNVHAAEYFSKENPIRDSNQ